MAHPPVTDEQCLEAYNAVMKADGNLSLASRQSQIPRRTLRRRYDAAQQRGLGIDPSIREAAKAGGIDNPSNLSHFWKIVKDDDGNGYSLFVKNPDATGPDLSFSAMVRESIEDAVEDNPPKWEPRLKQTTGKYLLVVDLADVHFLKLAVQTETGYEYNRSVARHRVIEGTKELLRQAEHFGVARILFVMGNDILHTDNAMKTTTSGTPQDVDGTIFQGFKDASRAVIDAIEICAEVADVDLVHNMSNHDWVMGWALSQTIAAFFRGHPNVNATDYNMSEAHRKYYAFEQNLIGLAHGDSAKEEKLYGLLVAECAEYISLCKNRYWLLHHVHHKDRKTRDGNRPQLREKDHNGLTAIITGEPQFQGKQLNIEYVRSMSPPDGWHDRNGYINRQAVEAFLFDPQDGMKVRFTEWF